MSAGVTLVEQTEADIDERGNTQSSNEAISPNTENDLEQAQGNAVIQDLLQTDHNNIVGVGEDTMSQQEQSHSQEEAISVINEDSNIRENIDTEGHQHAADEDADMGDNNNEDNEEPLLRDDMEAEDEESDGSDDASSEAEDQEDDDEVVEEEQVEEGVQVVRVRGGLLRHLPRLPRLVFHRLRRRYEQVFGNIQFRELADTEGSDDESRNIERPESITFDKNLPISHSYLGEMNDCSGVQYIDQESFITLPILRVPDFILVPGQTMPLNITRPQEVSLLKSVLARPDKTFGVILLKNAYGVGSPSAIDFGCTAELRSMREEEVYEIQTMVGIAIGRQRFKLVEKRPQPDGNLVGRVQILNDDEFSPPASGASLGVHYKHSIIPSTKSARRMHVQHSSRNHPGWLTRCPPWLYNMYDVKILRKLLIKELKDWNPDLDEKSLPTSSSAFSFWIASHLLITNTMRLFLLQIDCSIQRLRCELDLLKKCTIYACINCGNHITQKQHLFNMSVSGPMDAYVNPSGHIHETLTVYVSQGLIRVSRPSTEHSWFPGYAWTICECACCGRHMGWKFTATKDSLTPKNFWGLTRSSLSPKVEIEDMTEKGEEGGGGRRRRLTSDDSSNSSGSISSVHHNLNWRPMM